MNVKFPFAKVDSVWLRSVLATSLIALLIMVSCTGTCTKGIATLLSEFKVSPTLLVVLPSTAVLTIKDSIKQL
ncbi:hypothetical protein [Streptococcus canis]|uniref:hypothetical protein n=1 Tax=Streptococcus canis TaxID=1329 RepID=UPI001F082961|nr:hypothetical protein [Streptococcus canis]